MSNGVGADSRLAAERALMRFGQAISRLATAAERAAAPRNVAGFGRPAPPSVPFRKLAVIAPMPTGTRCGSRCARRSRRRKPRASVHVVMPVCGSPFRPPVNNWSTSRGTAWISPTCTLRLHVASARCSASSTRQRAH